MSFCVRAGSDVRTSQLVASNRAAPTNSSTAAIRTAALTCSLSIKEETVNGPRLNHSSPNAQAAAVYDAGCVVRVTAKIDESERYANRRGPDTNAGARHQAHPTALLTARARFSTIASLPSAATDRRGSSVKAPNRTGRTPRIISAALPTDIAAATDRICARLSDATTAGFAGSRSFAGFTEVSPRIFMHGAPTL